VIRLQNRKKLLCCVLAAALLLPNAAYGLPAGAEPDETAAEDAAADAPAEETGGENQADPDWVDRTEKDVFQARLKAFPLNSGRARLKWEPEVWFNSKRIRY
jgi:hypothetical protein